MRACLKSILSRAIIFYLACFCLIGLILDYHQLATNAVGQAMSRLTPPVDYFAEFVDRRDHYDRFKLMECVNYHKAVARFFDYQKSEAYAMMGFCYERLGQEPQAVASYKQAIAFNSEYFWPYYDLGLIFYRQGQYPQAQNYLLGAVEQVPVKTLVLLSKSKIFQDVGLSERHGTYDFYGALKEGRMTAYVLLLDSLYKTGSYVQLLNVALNGTKDDLDDQGIFYYYAGVAAFYLKSYPKAIEFLQMAIRDDPRNADAFLYMGLCLKMMDKMDVAQLFITKAAQLHGQGFDVTGPYLKARVRFF